MTKRLNGKFALVTGASRGIGRAVALALADEGAHVVAAARNADDLQSLAKEIEAKGVRVLAVSADLTQQADVDRLAAETQKAFGQVDILVNNAGVGKFGTLDTLSADDYDWMMNVNMRATFLCTRAFYPPMAQRGAGSVIFLGSVAGLKGLPRETVYCASKHAQYGFAMSLDYEARESGVKVSYVAPGGVNSYFAFGTGRTQGDPVLEEFLDNEDVAEAVIFAVTQPPKSRVFLIGMRPMREPL
jgi:NADP-dependent 3-hydroxy acid dehydrogenase YdfG